MAVKSDDMFDPQLITAAKSNNAPGQEVQTKNITDKSSTFQMQKNNAYETQH